VKPEGFEESTLCHTKLLFSSGAWTEMKWAGVQALQTPNDMMMVGEAIFDTLPTLIVECGVYAGGLTVFMSHVLHLIRGGGRVVGIDIDLSRVSKETIDRLKAETVLIQGSSTDPSVVAKVKDMIRPESRVMVILDSDHSKANVAWELEIYSPLVTPGCYLVAMDGVMKDLWNVQGGMAVWKDDNPHAAIMGFLPGHPEFEVDPSKELYGITFCPDGFLKKKA